MLRVIQLVLYFFSPYDLLQLARTSGEIFNLLVGPLADCWRRARDRLQHVPGPPAVSAAGCWTELAYSDFLFGRSPCITCSELCGGLPFVFALRFRSLCALHLTDPTLEESHSRLSHWTVFMACSELSGASMGLRAWLPSTCASNFIPPALVYVRESEYRQAARVDAGAFIPDDPRFSQCFVKRSTAELNTEWCHRIESWPGLLQSRESKIPMSTNPRNNQAQDIDAVAAALVRGLLDPNAGQITPPPVDLKSWAGGNGWTTMPTFVRNDHIGQGRVRFVGAVMMAIRNLRDEGAITVEPHESHLLAEAAERPMIGTIILSLMKITALPPLGGDETFYLLIYVFSMINPPYGNIPLVNEWVLNNLGTALDVAFCAATNVSAGSYKNTEKSVEFHQLAAYWNSQQMTKSPGGMVVN
ncbi:hypothetical protein DFH09DRAFT_1366415 [Mycena vulgaris]|nr:hypothetical protein DFH09DRAFT_1366415 [Mycena vulgaris]